VVPAGSVVLRGHRECQLVEASGSGRGKPVPSVTSRQQTVVAAGTVDGSRLLRERGCGRGVLAAETGFVFDIRQTRSGGRQTGHNVVRTLGMRPRIRGHRAAGC